MTATRDRRMCAGDSSSTSHQTPGRWVKINNTYVGPFPTWISPHTIRGTSCFLLCFRDEETEIRVREICSRPECEFSIEKLICFLWRLSCEVETPISSQLVAVEMMLEVTEVRSRRWKSSFKTHKLPGHDEAVPPINVCLREPARAPAFSPT